MKTLKKPELQTETNTETFYYFDEVETWLEKKLGYPLRDPLGHFQHFYLWCDAQGYGQVDPQGKPRNASQAWFAEYNLHPEGFAKCPEYRDFWRWFANQYDIDNGTVITLSPDYDIQTLTPEDAWIREVLECLKTEFGENPPVLVEW